MTHVPWHSMETEEQEEIHGIDSVELTSVGIDIGTTTTHLMFSRLLARRQGQDHTSSFQIVERETTYESPILLTPFDDDNTIDAEAIEEFIERSYDDAGYATGDIDTGAVITTGEASRKANAEAITELFSEQMGKFVCAAAGANLEALLAAHGSGAIDHSLEHDVDVLHIDIGGGTTKFAYIVDGFVEETASINVGARLVEFDDTDTIKRIEDAARRVSEELGISLQVGSSLPERKKLADKFARLIFQVVDGELSALADDLMVTERPDWGTPDRLTFSGGVSEYIYGSDPGYHNDLGPELGETIKTQIDASESSTEHLESGIRATVAGSTNHSMQVSGNTITISDTERLPLRNVPMVPYVIDHDNSLQEMEEQILEKLDLYDVDELDEGFAMGFHLHGLPTHDFLDRVVDAAITGWNWADGSHPLVLAFDSDVGMNTGLLAAKRVDRPVISVDNIDLSQFAYIDIGEPLEETNAVPITVKSLVFEG